jgi:hypothetical protein
MPEGVFTAQQIAINHIFPSPLPELFPMLDCSDQEKHRAARFVPHFGMLV